MYLCRQPLTLLLPSLSLPQPPLAVQVGDDLGRQLDVIPHNPLVRRQPRHCPDSPGDESTVVLARRADQQSHSSLTWIWADLSNSHQQGPLQKKILKDFFEILIFPPWDESKWSGN